MQKAKVFLIKKTILLALWGVLGTFLGGLGGGVEESEVKPFCCPKMDGE